APSPTTEVPTPLPELVGDPVRGGQLYDSWWNVTGAEKPTSDQPLWSTQSTNTRTGADTWRCKECHGWDYKGKDGAYGSGSHQTGFPGVFPDSSQPPSEILGILTGGTNQDHDFSGVMDGQALTDLALFLAQAQIDTAEVINPDKTPIGGTVDAGKTLYEGTCAACHGPQGTALNFGDSAEPEYVGTIAADNPWEFLHKVRFGQPGSAMPSAITTGWTTQNLVDLLAYAQTLPTGPSLSLGGQLYDKWWEVTGADAPTSDQSLWASQTTNARTGADTWRCKECHGWDYKGVDGAYGSGSHATGFPGVLAGASLTPEELTAWLNGQSNPDHDFSGALDESQLLSLVAFLKEGLADTAAFINADKTVNGDSAQGASLYAGTCEACHGVDGKTLNFGDAAEPEFVGTIAADNPWEFFHKIRFGQPGAPMPSGVDLGWTLQQIADLLAYAQSLPSK
ncbi:MAG TPA: c-type cytochrome, partial [Anaerolineales bacterium]|nr:c-type cytochrome [Anaerolineales bacterium]